MDRVSLLVLGDGVDGLAAALALAHQGFPVHVLDRGPDPRDAVTGRPGCAGAVSISPDGARELALLGLLDQVATDAAVPCRLLHADAVTGAPLRRAELGHAVVNRYGHPFLLVRRTALRAALAVACAADEMIVVEYGRPVVGVDDVGDGVVVTGEDGGRFHAETVVGADGPTSVVRTALRAGPPLSPPYLRYEMAGPATPGGDIRLWSSPDVHVVQAPVPGGTEVSLVVRLDPQDELRHVATDEAMARLVARQHPDVQGVVADVVGRPPAQVHRHQSPFPPGAHHRMTVCGRAAAPMLPHTAQATTLALLDAGALGRAFDRADGRIVDALTDYAAARRPMWARRARQAWEFAAVCHADGLVRRMRDRLWRDAPFDDVASIVGWAPGELGGGATN